MKPVDLSAVSRNRWWGRLLRAPLRLVPDHWVIPVLQGPACGLRWIVGSSNHGCWLGSYEREQTACFVNHTDPGNVVYDLGAHVGWYTLIASRKVGPEGSVVAFEPVAENLEFLERHLELNGADNVQVWSAAVSSSDGEASFATGDGRFTGSLTGSVSGDRVVETVMIDRLVEADEISAPDLMKVDVEGAESEALLGARETLRSSRPRVLLSTHGPTERQECAALLGKLCYILEPVGGDSWDSADVFLARPEEEGAGREP